MSEEKIKAYKAFDKDMKCLDFQYEVGKEYSMDGDISICNRGFHACECPMDMWNYYDMTTSRFAVVEQSGQIDKSIYDTKVCSSKIKIKAELKLADIINLGVEWVKNITSPSKVKTDDKLNDNESDYAKIGSSGDYAQIGSSGDYAKIGSSGDFAKIGSSGCFAKIGSSGDSAKIGSSGDFAKIGSSDFAQIGSSGDYAQIGSSGDYAQIGSSGDYAQIGSSSDSAQIGSSGCSAKIGLSGDYAQIGSSGCYAKIDSSGDSAQIGSSGCSAQIGSSGDSAKIDSSGDSAKIGSSGDFAKIKSEGQDSVVMCAGVNSIASAKIGSWITLAEWKYDKNEERWIPVCVKTERVDGERIKADTFYRLKDGEFVEAEP